MHPRSDPDPRIAVVAPRNMRFSPNGATSIDLHIHETVRSSRYRGTITVFAEEVADPFRDVDVRFWPKGATGGAVAALVRDERPDMIVVHQHLPTASVLARRFPRTPVALVRHNFQKPPRNRLSGALKRRRFERLAEIAFVSDCCRDDFLQAWPGLSTPVSVVLNGIDGALWRPASEKEPLIVFIGRLVPEKGALDAARAMAEVARERDGWRGMMIVATSPGHEGYARQVRETVAGTGGRVEMLSDVGHDVVRDWAGRASISLAPTRTQEPFGRVAVEAMASGAVPIATNRGGFVEIVGEDGILLDDPDARGLADAILALIDDEGRRRRLAAAGRERVLPRYGLATAAATFDALVARHCRPGAAP